MPNIQKSNLSTFMRAALSRAATLKADTDPDTQVVGELLAHCCGVISVSVTHHNETIDPMDLKNVFASGNTGESYAEWAPQATAEIQSLCTHLKS